MQGTDSGPKRNFLKVALFSLAVVACYTLFASVYAPDAAVDKIEDAPAPAEALNPSELVRLGARIYNGKGACALCHEGSAGRAPGLDSIAETFSRRIKDSSYKGSAKDVEAYIVESMKLPSVYVVKGYGVKGSNDTLSPMPDVSKEPLGLTDAEIGAVAAYLKSRAGIRAEAIKK